MKSQLIKIENKLRKQMETDRFRHTLGVMYTAASLAIKYGVNMDKAMLAGLLHDCAKIRRNSSTKLLSICKKNHIYVSVSEQKKPGLLHAKVGAYLAYSEHHIKDREVLSAIACHTTGKPQMTDLDKIIFIADFMEPNRSEAACLPVVRNLAYQNLDECLYRILEESLEYLKKPYSVIDPMTEKTYNYYKRELDYTL